MQIIIIPVILIIIGYVFLLISEIMPVFKIILFPWFGMIFCTGASVYLLYRLFTSQTLKNADKPKKWKHLINYLRRDNTVVPIEGVRAYPGESFIDVQGLGLIEFLGKDCYYTWGDKKIIWGLENINFTPDPRYYNFCHLLWELGFSDSDDVYKVFNGLDLELMGTVYQKMRCYDEKHGVNKLVSELKEYDGKNIVFQPKKTTGVLDVHKKIDDIIKNKKMMKEG